MKSKKPLLVSIDDDPQVLRSVTRDLRNRYRDTYQVVGWEKAEEALEEISGLKKENREVALFLSDQRMPSKSGVEFLSETRQMYPQAKRVLLTAYSDIEAAIRAINEVQLDYYLLKPWDPPQEKLYPVLDDLLDSWESFRAPGKTGLKIIGFPWSPDSHRIKDFLASNMIPYHWTDLETENEEAERLLGDILKDPAAFPVVITEDAKITKNPATPELASLLNLKTTASRKFYDVIIVGGGPAGLAAAVYGASEGLKTLLLERKAPGGQAGTSSRIENYLGFPAGLSGADLARRAQTQAIRLGAEFSTPCEATDISSKDGYHLIMLQDGTQIQSRSVILSTGVSYRELDSPGIKKLTGSGVYYGAATTEAQSTRGGDAFVVGGGNSAGQAAMYLSQFANNVYIIIRKNDLSGSMSRYLIEQIERTPNIHLKSRTRIREVSGENRLENLEWENLDDNTREIVRAKALFIFIGARPHTDWLKKCLILDEKGFVLTGRDLESHPAFKNNWKQQRRPEILETSVSGMFAAGDVRSGAMNRIASAVGEGALSIKLVHEYLARG